MHVKDDGEIKHWIERIRSSDNVSCYWCTDNFNGKDMHIDHVIPVSKGGSHSIGNLCASCVSCNTSKKAKSIKEWNKTHLSSSFVKNRNIVVADILISVIKTAEHNPLIGA